MPFESLMDKLPQEVRAAVEYLECAGFLCMFETRIERTRTRDTGRRTFQRRGQYELVLALKDMSLAESPGPLADPDMLSNMQGMAKALDDAGIKFTEMESRIQKTEAWADAVGQALHEAEKRADDAEKALVRAEKKSSKKGKADDSEDS